jgi:hypothetical protein
VSTEDLASSDRRVHHSSRQTEPTLSRADERSHRSPNRATADLMVAPQRAAPTSRPRGSLPRSPTQRLSVVGLGHGGSCTQGRLVYSAASRSNRPCVGLPHRTGFEVFEIQRVEPRTNAGLAGIRAPRATAFATVRVARDAVSGERTLAHAGVASLHSLSDPKISTTAASPFSRAAAPALVVFPLTAVQLSAISR